MGVSKVFRREDQIHNIAETRKAVSEEEILSSSAIADQLFLEMCERSPMIENTRDSAKINYHYLEAARYAGRISAGDFSNPNIQKPIFRLNPTHFSSRLQTHLLESKKDGTLNEIVKEAVFKLFKARHKMIFYEHIEPKKLRWEFVK